MSEAGSRIHPSLVHLTLFWVIHEVVGDDIASSSLKSYDKLGLVKHDAVLDENLRRVYCNANPVTSRGRIRKRPVMGVHPFDLNPKRFINRNAGGFVIGVILPSRGAALNIFSPGVDGADKGHSGGVGSIEGYVFNAHPRHKRSGEVGQLGGVGGAVGDRHGRIERDRRAADRGDLLDLADRAIAHYRCVSSTQSDPPPKFGLSPQHRSRSSSPRLMTRRVAPSGRPRSRRRWRPAPM